MAYRSSGSNNVELVHNLKRNGIFSSKSVENGMLAVDRGNYCPHDPYFDSPQTIGYGATISAPHMHAHALELLVDNLTEGKKALDIGSGSGYLTACMALMVGSSGKAVGVDHIPELVNMSIENVRSGNPGLLESDRVKLVVGDGRLGYREKAPYDAIHVGAAATTIPKALTDQLAIGGRLVLPVGPAGGYQVFKQVDKVRSDYFVEKDIMDVIYVLLTDKNRQWSSSASVH